MKTVSIKRTAGVLLVDDDISRRGWVLSRHRLPHAFVTDRPADAIRILQQFDISTVLLDWDLGLGVDSSAVALFLADKPHIRTIIVSVNPFGMEVLKRALPRADVHPFGSFELKQSRIGAFCGACEG